MNLANPYLKQYKKNEIETSSPEQILILLYDAAINYLNKAKFFLEEGDDDKFHHNMLCCKNIIAEFMNSLDMEQGGEWATVLYNLYKYLRKIVIKSDITKNINGIDEVSKHLTNLRDTWAQAIEIAKNEKKSELMDQYKNNADPNTESINITTDELDDDDEEEEDEE